MPTIRSHNIRLVFDRLESTNASLDVHVGLGKKSSSPSHVRNVPCTCVGIVLHDRLLYVVSLLLPCGIQRFFVLFELAKQLVPGRSFSAA